MHSFRWKFLKNFSNLHLLSFSNVQLQFYCVPYFTYAATTGTLIDVVDSLESWLWNIFLAEPKRRCHFVVWLHMQRFATSTFCAISGTLLNVFHFTWQCDSAFKSGKEIAVTN